MRQQQPVEFLPHQVRGLAAQDDLRSPKMGLQFVEGPLDLTTFMVKSRQFLGRSQRRFRNVVSKR